jgi:hypothetical protein
MYDVNPLYVEFYLKELKRQVASQTRLPPRTPQARRFGGLRALARSLLRNVRVLRPARQ